MKTDTLKSKSLATLALAAFVVSSFAGLGNLNVAQAATNWDVSGDYVISMEYDGSYYNHNVSLSQDAEGDLTGDGSSGAYTWEITSGNVDGSDIEIHANYTATADAVDPLTTLHLEGSIAGNGTLSGTWSDNYQGGERSGTWTTVSGAAVLDETTDYVTTNAATAISASGATLNGRNEDSAATGHSFWVSLAPFSTSSPSLPSGVYSTPDLGAIAADTNFSAALSSVTGLPVITADTTYYFAAWTLVDGVWRPGEVLNFTTNEEDSDPETVQVTILKYVDGALATGVSAENNDFTMNASWDSDNLGEGSGQYALSENGFGGDTTPYQAKTVEMTAGASYSTSEVMNDLTGASCDAGKPYSLVGYTSGDSLAAAQTATIGSSANLTNITSDKYIIVWNDDCSTPTSGGNIGGDVVDGEGTLAVTSIQTIDSTAVADGTFENGWEYVFNITVPTDEPDLAMKFANWAQTGGSGTIAAANNFRISSTQADNGGATVLLSAADTYSTPKLHLTGDLNPSLPGLQVQVRVEARVPSGTANGSYTTSYGVLTE